MAKNNFEQQTWIKNIEDIMSDSFGKYAKYIIQDRALPDVRDGLKPVQRRILFAMNELGLSYDKPHKKSARTVGEVIGKYHPHGDTSIYDAMVRMSQSWKSNAPQLDMHGNNGSIDGDSAAAMRYTEARLSRFGQTMMDSIYKNTVPFIFNFDDSEKEPSVLPTLLPNLLVNGVSGIAAGYATNIPPFNFNEVVDAIITRIDSPNCRLESILKVMPGPDFPTSGIILNKSGIIEAYETGRGKITIRAKIEYNKQNKQVIISEIPFETSKAEIVKKIDELRMKHEVLQINEVRDESDINGISIVLDVKNDKNYDLLKNFLYKNTQLQISYNINAVAIKNRKPYLMPMLMILDSFIEHANDVIIKSSKFDLDKAVERQEILNGLIKAIKLLDDVIETIKKSEGKQAAKQALMNKFNFSEKQSEAIVNLRLYRLSTGDINEINNELRELEVQINELNGLLNNDSLRNNYLKSKLRDFKKIFGQERKSLITDDDDKIIIDQADIIENKNQIVLVTRDGYLKSITNKGFAANEYTDLKLKDGDIPVSQFISNQRDKVVLITNKGNYIVIPTFKIPNTKWKEMGTHFNNIVVGNEQEKIIFAFNFTNNVSDNRKLLLATKNGLIKQTLISNLNIGKNAKLSNCISLDNNDELISACIFNNDFNGNVFLITKHGLGLKYPIEQISLVGKNAAGVKSIGLKSNDSVISAFIDNNAREMIALFTKNGGKRIKKDLIIFGSRGNIGRTLINQVKSNPIELITAFEINSNEMINVVDNNNKWLVIKAVDVPIGSNETRVSAVKNIKFNLVNKNYLINDEIVEENGDQEKQDSLFDN